MKMVSFITGGALLALAAAPAYAVECRSTGFDGGIPSAVTSLTITDNLGTLVMIDDFTTNTIVSSDPDNASASNTYDKFTFGASAITALSDAELTMGSGIIIKGSSGDLVAEVECD